MAEQLPTPVGILAFGDRESGGGGSTAARFIEGTQTGEVAAEVRVVICNNPPGTVGVYDHVERLNREYGLDIPVLTINGKTHPLGKNERGQTDEEASAICEALTTHGVFLALQLGYMKQSNGELIEEYGWHPRFGQEDPEHNGIYLARLINTHPGILPQTANTHGVHASEWAIELDLPYTAHTLHVVSSGMDTGPVIAEHRVDITTTNPEELFEAVQVEEKGKICGAIDTYLKAQRAYLG